MGASSPGALVLASASPRRRALLKRLISRFEARPCRLREPAQRPETVSPPGWAEALAYFKARAVAERCPDRWVLGADTVVLCQGQVLGKPAGRRDARRMLRLQAGRESEVITGLSLVRVGECLRRIMGHERTRVWMRDDAAAIEAYLASGRWRGKAGGYGIQEGRHRLVARVAGSFSNVVGLPLERVARMLAASGLALPARRAGGPAPGGSLPRAVRP